MAMDGLIRKILHALQAEGRISSLDLAGRVGLSLSACLRRVRDLERRGVITGAVEYMLRVEVADLSACKRFHTDVLGTLPQAHAITSDVVMGSPRDMRA